VSDELTAKQAAFVEAYADCLNATEAARRAGYAKPRQEGSRLLSNADIRPHLDAALSKRTMPKSEVLTRYTAIAQADVRELLRFAEEDLVNGDGKVVAPAGTVLGLRLHRDAPLHLIKSITPTKYGDKIELHDPLAALGKIGEAYGIFRNPIADGLDAIATAARSLEQKLMADVAGAEADSVPGKSDDGGESGAPA